MMFDTDRMRDDFLQGLDASVSSWKRILSTFLFSALIFLATALSTNISYSMQMLQSGVDLWPYMVLTRVSGLVALSGMIGLFLTVLFSILAGVTLTNTIVQLSLNRLSSDFLGTLPGLLVGGCASCGVGILSLVGLGGVVASLPFQGNLLRTGGILLVVALITRTGNPETCPV